MLILHRYLGQKLRVGKDVEVKVLGSDRGQVRLGIEAPKGIAVHRKEVFERMDAENTVPEVPSAVSVSCKAGR